MTLPSIRRVVTGHDENAKAIISSDGPLPTVAELAAIPGTVFHEVWATDSTPVVIGNGADVTIGSLMLAPPKNGTRIRFVDMPPDTQEFLDHGAGRMKAMFSQVGDAGHSTVNEGSPHPLMHRTETVDYGIVIEGEVSLILDNGEAALKRGDVVIQRGTNHAWANRSDQMCRMLFILVDGVFEPWLTA